MAEFEEEAVVRETPFVRSRRASFVTLALILAQLGSCVAGLAGFDPVTDFFTCMNPEQPFALEKWAVLIWAVLTFSWLVGIVALAVPRVRPVYWGLLAAIPLFAAWQQWMVAEGHYTCRFHI